MQYKSRMRSLPSSNIVESILRRHWKGAGSICDALLRSEIVIYRLRRGVKHDDVYTPSGDSTYTTSSFTARVLTPSASSDNVVPILESCLHVDDCRLGRCTYASTCSALISDLQTSSVLK